MAAAALALPLTLLMVGSGGGIIFDPTIPYAAMGAPYWVLVIWGLCELALGVAVWIPYLHRIVGLVIAFDAVVHAAVYSGAGHKGTAAMYFIVGGMALAITALWTSQRVPLPEQEAPARRLAA